MLDRFLAIEGVNPDIALAFALAKQAHRLRNMADEMNRLLQSLVAQGADDESNRPGVRRLERIQKWLASVAEVTDGLTRIACNTRVACGGVEPHVRALPNLLPVLLTMLHPRNRLQRALEELHGVIQGRKAGDSSDPDEVMQAMTRQQDELYTILEEMCCLSRFIAARVGPPTCLHTDNIVKSAAARLNRFAVSGVAPLPTGRVADDRRTGCRRPERVLRIRDLLRAGHTMPQVITATGIPKGIVYYLFHHYLAGQFPHAVASRQPYTE